MPTFGATITVGTSPVQVDGNSVNWTHIHIRNNDTTKNLYVGGADVSPSNGFLVGKLESLEFDLMPGDSVFMVTDSGTVSVSWLKVHG